MQAEAIVNPPDTTKMTYVERVMNEMDERQALYVQLLGQGWGKRAAARSAGYPTVLTRKPLKAIETPELKAKMQRALIRQGATMDKAARVVSEAMNANLTASFEGEVIQSEIADHRTRVQAAKLTADLAGITERADRSQAGSTLTLTIGGALADRIAERMGKVIEGK
jgi:hypothetical protein